MCGPRAPATRTPVLPANWVPPKAWGSSVSKFAESTKAGPLAANEETSTSAAWGLSAGSGAVSSAASGERVAAADEILTAGESAAGELGGAARRARLS